MAPNCNVTQSKQSLNDFKATKLREFKEPNLSSNNDVIICDNTKKKLRPKSALVTYSNNETHQIKRSKSKNSISKSDTHLNSKSTKKESKKRESGDGEHKIFTLIFKKLKKIFRKSMKTSSVECKFYDSNIKF